MVGHESEDGPAADAPTPPETAAADPTVDPDGEQPKPLYRDEIGDDTPTTVTSPKRPALARRPPDEATQILPRTRRTNYSGSRSDFDPPDEDDDLGDLGDERPRLGRRTTLALVIAGVAAVAVVGLAIGYAVLNLGDRATGTPSGQPSVSGPSSGPSGSASDPNVLLTDAAMLSAAQAKQIDGDRTWKVALTQRGVDQGSRAPACLGPGTTEGLPASQQSVLRVLSSSGTKAPSVLHEAVAYATPEDAALAYNLTAKALGSCTMTGGYLQGGRVVTGLGDQSTGVVVHVADGTTNQLRSVVLNRTGRIVNVVDVAKPDQAVGVTGVAKALAAVTNTQCKAADGRCAASTTVKAGPPPLPGADQPGYLAAGDLPPVGQPPTPWAGTVPGPPDADYSGSGCETVDWLRVAAEKRTARTYLLTTGSPTFGLDQIVLTGKTSGAAQDLVKQVKDDLESCAKRTLTASVSKPAKISGTGSSGAKIDGWTAVVTQKSDKGTTRYRVGIASAGTKTVYTFLNPQPQLDLTDAQWDVVTVRAAERATQVK